MKRFLVPSPTKGAPERPPGADVALEKRALALSVGIEEWPYAPPIRRGAGRPPFDELYKEALAHHIERFHELPDGVSADRPCWWRPGMALGRPLEMAEALEVAYAVPVPDSEGAAQATKKKPRRQAEEATARTPKNSLPYLIFVLVLNICSIF